MDQTRHHVAIKADIVERIECKSIQNDARCSDPQARDWADELDPVTLFQLWCCSFHMVGYSIIDAPGSSQGASRRSIGSALLSSTLHAKVVGQDRDFAV